MIADACVYISRLFREYLTLYYTHMYSYCTVRARRKSVLFKLAFRTKTPAKIILCVPFGYYVYLVVVQIIYLVGLLNSVESWEE